MWCIYLSTQASFLIPPEIVPGRMTLLVTLFLVLINIFTNITTNSPNVEGLTSISAWVIICILFVFGALLGYAGLLIKKKILVKVVMCCQIIYCHCNDYRFMGMTSNLNYQIFQRDHATHRASLDYWHGHKLTHYDDILIRAFPILFLVFNVIYWPICLT